MESLLNQQARQLRRLEELRRSRLKAEKPSGREKTLVLLVLPRPGCADHFDGGIAARVAFAGGFERAAVGLLQCIPISSGVFLGELRAANSHFQQPGSRLIV